MISHYNVMPVIDIFGGVSGRDFRGLLRDLKPLIAQAEHQLPKGNSITLRGQAETMHSSFTGLGIGLVMAMVLIYLLLVVNFHSWLDPFIIITALPVRQSPNHAAGSACASRCRQNCFAHRQYRRRDFRQAGENAWRGL